MTSRINLSVFSFASQNECLLTNICGSMAAIIVAFLIFVLIIVLAVNWSVYGVGERLEQCCILL